MEGGERHEVECGVEGEAEQMKKEDKKASLSRLCFLVFKTLVVETIFKKEIRMKI